MVQLSASCSAERAELETVLAALARTPRLAKLLNFLGERALQGRTAEISEYAIATEVFDRSKSSFDGSVDSIARVETHRLRKRLKEYYETEGKDHAIVISLPFRSYTPEFSRRPAAQPSTPPPIVHTTDPQQFPQDSSIAEESEGSAAAVAAERGVAVPNRDRSRMFFYAAGVIILFAVGFGAIKITRARSAHPQGTAGANPQTGSRSVTAFQAAHVPLRLLAGYQGSPRIDSAGAYWEADHYYSGSAAFERPSAPIARTSDPMLFEHWRTGDFSYDIPLAPGTYELHLFFVASPPDDKSQFFDVRLNGDLLLKAFNISADVLGTNIADEKVFRDVSPGADGYIHLKFTTGQGTALVNAIEILPGLPHRQLPIRLVMQSTAVTDHSGNLWHPDNYYLNGVRSDLPRRVSGTPDPNLYSEERYGHFTYSIPVDTHGRYTLILHFAELYWVPEASGSIGAGTRVFSVYCNGSTLLDHFDIYKEAGSLQAISKSFYHLRPTPEGKLDLTFDPIANFATVSAIEVIDESE